MNAISSWSIRNPVPTIVLFLSLSVAGVYGFMQLRTNNMPDIDLPTVTVTVAQPGAAPSEMEVQVARVIENAVATLEGVDDVSTSISEGSSVTTVEFTLGIDPETATNDVRSAVSGVQSSLPAAAQTPVVAKVNATGNSMLTFVVEAPTMSPDALSWYIDNDVAKVLLGVDGVSKITRAGGVDRVIRVELDPDRLAALGISAGDVSQTLASNNVNQPGGRANIGGQEQSVRTLASATTVEALADTRIALSGAGGVKLSDLGTVVDSWEKPRQAAYLDGRQVVAFNVYRSVGSSEIDVVKAARAAIADMGAKTTTAKFTEVTSSSGFVQESYDAALEALWLGALLAIGVVWLFLRDIRATLVSAVAMPLSLIPTFAVMAAFNISLNNITLLALSLVVGILVDDAIVEIENIVRHMRQTGVSAYQAAIEAADEIGLAVVATTATIVAVFLPVAFMSGIPGKFFLSFAVVVCISVLFSLLVARMLTPLMGAYLVRAGGHEEGDMPAWVPAYLWLLRKALDHRWITLLAGIAFFAGSMMLATHLPTEFMAAADRGRSMISVELQPGSTIEQTTAVVQDITKRLKKEPAVDSVFATIGTAASSGGGPNQSSSSAEVRTATVTVNLKPRAERTMSQQQFEAEASPKLNDIPGARIQFGADGFSGAKVSITLVGDDGEALAKASDALIDAMKSVPGLINPTSTAATTKPELIVRPDSAKAAELGVTPTEIAATVKIATIGDTDTSLAKFNLGDRQVSIIVTLPDGAIDDPAKLAMLPLTGSRGTVPLGAAADIGFNAGPNSITRVDRSRSATVEADLSGLTLGQATTAIRALPIMKSLPQGVHELARGDAQRMQELFSGFATAIAAGIILMYLTLVLLFRSFVQPVTILVALPLSVGGALGFLLITGKALGVSPLIGILMLMGIAAKNSILLVEYALVAEKEHGMGRFEALLDAARKRARPIVMTSIAMGAGMLPIALGIGADAETRAPMAIAVIGGLISSTVLSLVYVPVVYSFMDDIQRFLARHLRKLLVEAPGATDQARAAIPVKELSMYIQPNRSLSLARPRRLSAWAGTLCAALLLAACSQEKSQVPAGMGGAGRPEVGVVTLHPQSVAITAELPGRTAASLVAEVRPQVDGIIRQRLFQEGAEVVAGQPLYVIDSASYQAAYDSAVATQQKAEAAVPTARAKFDRYAGLLKQNVVSKQDYDDAAATLAQALADVAAAKASVETAKISLDRTSITAPIAGRIDKSSLTPGALVTANQETVLTTIRSLDPINVDVTQSSTNLLNLRQAINEGRLKFSGTNVSVKLKLDNGTIYAQNGKLEFAGANVDQSTGTFALRAQFPNPDRLLLPGMYVRAIVEEGVAQNSFLVPQRGVTRDPKGQAAAMVVNAQGKVEQRVLSVRNGVGNNWLVDSGVGDGDRVIVEGLQLVRVGGDATAVEVTIDETTGEIKDRQQSSASATATSGNAAGAAKQPASGATGN